MAKVNGVDVAQSIDTTSAPPFARPSKRRTLPWLDLDNVNGVDVAQSIDTTQLIGMNDDGSVSGLPIDEMTDLDTGFADNELCSDSCFWKKTNRSGLKVKPWLNEDRELVRELLPAYVHNKRAACMIALAVQKPCVEVSSSEVQSRVY